MAEALACRCVFQREDDDGVVGVALNRDLVKVCHSVALQLRSRMGLCVACAAGDTDLGLQSAILCLSLLCCQVASEALERNLTKLGPLVLPWSEKLKFVAVWLRRRLPGQRAKVKSYMPDFAKAFDHFCLHAGAPAALHAAAWLLWQS